MIINNNNINGYGHSSSLNTEMNDSLKNLHHSQSNGYNTRTGVVISESVLSHTNSLSINIKQANEQIIITQTATMSISLQSNILNQVNDKEVEEEHSAISPEGIECAVGCDGEEGREEENGDEDKQDAVLQCTGS